MIHRALVEGTLVWTATGLVPVEALKKPHRVYSPFGRSSQVWSVKNPKPEKQFMVVSDNGMRMLFGESHQFMARDHDTPQIKPCDLTWLINSNKSIHTLMPSRKWRLEDNADEDARKEEMLASFGSHEDKLPPGSRSKLYLEVENLDQMMKFSTWAGFYGMTVRLNPAQHHVELDEGRPTCFPTKLMIGADTTSMVNSLIDGHVFRPALPYDAFLELAKKTGVFFEAPGASDLRTLLQALYINQEADTWDIKSDDPTTTIELAHIRT